jgi:hypothetical protein
MQWPWCESVTLCMGAPVEGARCKCCWRALGIKAMGGADCVAGAMGSLMCWSWCDSLTLCMGAASCNCCWWVLGAKLLFFLGVALCVAGALGSLM